ncbi:MAG TPA: prenyltransferase/squalene oxidase repeat-containing protein [Pseudonocardiaceae bacterium]|nr:prenyltransferase/squalene oxidase repeat-containing protein [Pseudonocardiaceae bacterium]
MRTKRFAQRFAVVAATTTTALLITTSVVAAPATAGTPPNTNNPAKAAAGWLDRQLTDGQRIEWTFDGFTDEDRELTAFTVLALDSAGVGRADAARATAWLAQPDVLRGYVGNGTTESFVFAHALIALVAQAQGRNPNRFGGVNLLGEIRAQLAGSGQFLDRSANSDLLRDDVDSQSMAILALHRHGSVPKSAVDFLVSTQCADGGFDSGPVPHPSSGCVSDWESTALATQALLAVGRRGPVGRAMDWLQSQQRADGSFDGPPFTDSMFTGLPTLAFRLTHRVASAQLGISLLRSFQVGCAGGLDRGAVPNGRQLSRPGDFNYPVDLRSDALATLAFAGVSLADVSRDGAGRAVPILNCPTTG